ncbi:MAG: HlyD family efflux transporter periplasmic adaptor subunit, partial [Deltaproteobacteria bacterium]|nr:HlyD family efflux transporter periplasmic adaptor subunit [Deltaproteobacteria bacterium]
YIVKRLAEPGEWLTTGQVVGIVADYETLLVPFSLTVAQYEWVKKESQKKQLYLSVATASKSSPEAVKIPARLLNVSPAFDLVSRKITVELEISKGLSEMRGGIALEFSVELPEPGAVIAVPAAALVERYGAFWLIRADGEEIKVIKLGRTKQGEIKVAGDQIKPGDSFRCR